MRKILILPLIYMTKNIFQSQIITYVFAVYFS